MSRFDAPPEDFGADDFDVPMLVVPPRRASRPKTDVAPASPSRSSKSERARSRVPMEPQAPPRRVSRADFDEFAQSTPAPPRTRPKTNARPSDEFPGVRRAAKRGEKTLSFVPHEHSARSHTVRGPFQFSRFRSRLPVLSALHFEISGVFLLATGCILTYYATQSTVDGAFPAWALEMLRALFGVGAIVIPLSLVITGIKLFLEQKNARLRTFWGGVWLALSVFLTFKHLQLPRDAEFLRPEEIASHGGWLGGIGAFVLRRVLGEIGALIALGALALIALTSWCGGTLGAFVTRAFKKVCSGFLQGRVDFQLWWRSKRAKNQAERTDLRFESSQSECDDQWQTENWPPNPWQERLTPRMRSRSLAQIRAQNGEMQTSSLRKLRSDDPLDGSLAHEESSFFGADAATETMEIEEEALVPVAAAPVDPESSISEPRFLNEARWETVSPLEMVPRVQIVDAPPPPPVVAPVENSVFDLDIDLEKVVAGENADEILTPQQELERQALESANENEGTVAPVPRAPEKPRRSFGDGPLMPEYFDDAVRALDPPIPVDNSGAQEEIEKAVLGVQETLGSFKIDARVTDVKRGPVITRYEVQPGPGVRVAAIANLDKDLARALSALAVRIEAPVPGKNVVGIEIPNKKVHLVRMRDVLEQPEFLAHPSKIAFVLGKDIAGQPKWGDLAKMPHMLIAGATNSGKSVCLNAIIASILVRARPDEVRLSLIDPKRVELTLYRGIRHLMHDVVVEPKQAVVALRRAIEEMDRRYKLFAQHQVRNIASFNAKMEAQGQKKLPFIVIVIDELADLMMTAAAEFEKLICRLAQLARATGIHLIVATQRPSVNVITGVIKANIPARVAFAVASQVDSRTILDAVGAERLIGMGDMLFDANNGGKAVRIQGAFLSEDECNRIVEVVKKTYGFEEHDEEFADLPTFDLYSADDEDTDFEAENYDKKEEKRDSLYEEIVEFVLRHQEMSASNIQRKFGIGYPRAGRIVDQLERAGVLGPADGPKPRKVLGRPHPQDMQ